MQCTKFKLSCKRDIYIRYISIMTTPWNPWGALHTVFVSYLANVPIVKKNAFWDIIENCRCLNDIYYSQLPVRLYLSRGVRSLKGACAKNTWQPSGKLAGHHLSDLDEQRLCRMCWKCQFSMSISRPHTWRRGSQHNHLVCNDRWREMRNGRSQ